MPQDRSRQISFLKILLHAGFFVSGIATVLIGQVLPVLSTKFALNDELTANFFPAQFAGSLTGTFLTNWFGKRGRFLAASYIGCALMAIGVLLLNVGSYELCLLGFVINGLGIGLTLPAINMLVLELSPESTTASLNVLNFFWGFGAIVSQPFVDFLGRGTDILVPTGLLSGMLALIGVALALSPSGIEKKPLAIAEDENGGLVPIWTTAVAWIIAAFNFIHVGFESAMGGWLKTYTQRLDPTATSLFPPILIYFIFFVVGRGVAPVVFRFLDDNRMILVNLALTIVGVALLLSASTVGMLGIAAAIAGFGTSSIFPTNMSRFTKAFGPTASRRATPFFVCGTLGAACTTWLVGLVSTKFDNLRSGMFLLLFGLAVLIILQTYLTARRTVST